LVSSAAATAVDIQTARNSASFPAGKRVLSNRDALILATFQRKFIIQSPNRPLPSARNDGNEL
jgi:hypothetical protein